MSTDIKKAGASPKAYKIDSTHLAGSEQQK